MERGVQGIGAAPGDAQRGPQIRCRNNAAHFGEDRTMTRILASARRVKTIDVVGQSVVVRETGRRPATRTFRNRYTLRKFLSAELAQAAKRGMVSVNR